MPMDASQHALNFTQRHIERTPSAPLSVAGERLQHIMADQGPVQQGELPIRELPITGLLPYTKRMKVATLADRRKTLPSELQEWLFQTDLEDLLYPSVTSGTNSAFYRLLGRSEAGNGMTLPLRRSSVATGLVTEAEFNALKARMHSQVRVYFTLVPTSAVQMALATYGSTPASEALLTALELPRPAEWPSVTQRGEEEGEGDEEGGESEDGEGEGDGEDEGDGKDEGEGGAGDDGNGDGSSSDKPSRSDQSDSRSEHGGEGECPTTEEEAEPDVIDDEDDAGAEDNAEAGAALHARLWTPPQVGDA